MGQRHQIYIITKEEQYSQKTKKYTSKKQVYGFHNQWLYGKNALRTCMRVLRYASHHADDNGSDLVRGSMNYGSGLNSVNEKFKSLLQVDVETGYSAMVYAFQHNLNKDENFLEANQDPRFGDNNNGITIIDLRDLSNSKYCFMSVSHLEGLRDDMENNYENFKAMSAEHYLTLHYDLDEKPEADATIEDKKRLASHLMECRDLLVRFSVFDVLTDAEVKKLFPKMFKKEEAA